MLEKQYSNDFLKGMIVAAEAILLLREKDWDGDENMRNYLHENKSYQIMSIMQKLTEHQIKVLSLKELHEKVISVINQK